MSLPPTRASAVARDPAQGPWARSTSRRNGARPRPEAGPSHGGPPSCAPARHPPPRANLPPRGFGRPLATRRLKMAATTMPPPQTRSARSCLARRDKSIAKGNRNGHPTGRARYSRAPQMAATARFDASFCHSPGLPLSWAGARSGSGCGPAAALLPIASPVAKAAHPGLWRRARGGALVARQKGAPAASAELQRPPTGFFVPSAFT
jgi:hypothetical protein